MPAARTEAGARPAGSAAASLPAARRVIRTRWARRPAWVVCLLLLAAGCGNPGRHLKPGTYERGEAEYKGKRFTAAIEDLKLFVRRNPKDPAADDAQFLIGQCYMEAREYPLAAVEYEILRNDYPTSDLMDDASFLEAMAYARQRPDFRLDQKVTLKGLEALQRYLEQFPQGKHREQAQAELAALRLHLARKRYEQARQYARLEQPQAAAIVLDDLLPASQGSALRPHMLLLRGEMAVRMEDWEAARRFLGELLSQYPEHATAGRAKSLMRQLAKHPATNPTGEQVNQAQH